MTRAARQAPAVPTSNVLSGTLRPLGKRLFFGVPAAGPVVLVCLAKASFDRDDMSRVSHLRPRFVFTHSLIALVRQTTRTDQLTPNGERLAFLASAKPNQIVGFLDPTR
jgi:hypothetical protein